MKFSNDFHRKIINILANVNSNFLVECNAYFGGGSRLALDFDEYRWSKDIDFVCPSGPGYQKLRKGVFEDGYDALFTTSNGLKLPRPIQANQYGIRFPVEVDDTLIKFEIFNEARIQLEAPINVVWTNVPCLSINDCFSEKLLANADRWADVAVESRDIIDLCVLRKHHDLLQTAIVKSESAYPVIEPLKKSINYFQENPNFRKRCYDSLKIDKVSMIIDGLDMLAKDLQIPLTKRMFMEEDSI